MHVLQFDYKSSGKITVDEVRTPDGVYFTAAASVTILLRDKADTTTIATLTGVYVPLSRGKFEFAIPSTLAVSPRTEYLGRFTATESAHQRYAEFLIYVGIATGL